MSTVLVTGAGRGIGRAITEEFIRRGYRVIGTARDPVPFKTSTSPNGWPSMSPTTPAWPRRSRPRVMSTSW